MTMIRRNILRFLVLLAASTLCQYQTLSAAVISDIATMSGTDRQAKLEAGAKAEGEFSLYTTLIVDQAVLPLKAAFEKKYPFIKFN